MVPWSRAGFRISGPLGSTCGAGLIVKETKSFLTRFCVKITITDYSKMCCLYSQQFSCIQSDRPTDTQPKLQPQLKLWELRIKNNIEQKNQNILIVINAKAICSSIIYAYILHRLLIQILDLTHSLHTHWFSHQLYSYKEL